MARKPKKYDLLAGVGHSPKVAEPVAIYYSASSIDTFLSKVFKLIGMMFPLNFSQHQESDLIPIIRNGLSKKNLDHLMETTGLDLSTMAKILHISERTLHRYTSMTTLNPEISERIIEIARLYTKGEETFGDLTSFNSWMSNPSVAFEAKPPKEFLDTSLGIKLIEDELIRIEYGVFA